MKTLYIYNLKNYSEGEILLKNGARCFVIGVKTGDSLEWLQQRYPNLVIERLPEVANMNYLSVDAVLETHMLQPAFITWKEPAVVPAPVEKAPRKPF